MPKAISEGTARPVIYLLDTNAVTVFMKGGPAVIERPAATAPAEVAIPQPALAQGLRDILALFHVGPRQLVHALVRQPSQLRRNCETYCLPGH